MTRVLFVSQEKGGVGKSLVARALAEAVPASPIIEIDSARRLVELEKRTTFFPMRADRAAIESTGGRVARAEFDAVLQAIQSANIPTIVDVGANTSRSLLTEMSNLSEALTAFGIEAAVLVIVTAEPGAMAETPRLLELARPWAKLFVLENRLRGPVPAAELKRMAGDAPVSVLEEHNIEDEAVVLLQGGGLATIPKIDGKKLMEKHGLALGARIHRDLTRLRSNAIEAVRAPAEWLVGGQ